MQTNSGALTQVAPGDFVRLRSDGPRLVVKEIDKDGTPICEWELNGSMTQAPIALQNLKAW